MVLSLYHLAFRLLSLQEAWILKGLGMEIPWSSFKPFLFYRRGSVSPEERYLELRSLEALDDLSREIYEDRAFLMETISRRLPWNSFPPLPHNSKFYYELMPFTWRAVSLRGLCEYFSLGWGEVSSSSPWKSYLHGRAVCYKSFQDCYDPVHYLLAEYPDDILPSYVGGRDLEMVLELKALRGYPLPQDTPLSLKIEQMLIASGMDIVPGRPTPNHSLAACYAGNVRLVNLNDSVSALDKYLNALEGFFSHRRLEKFLEVVRVLPLESRHLPTIGETSSSLPIDVIDYLYFKFDDVDFLVRCLLNNLGYVLTVRYCLEMLEGRMTPSLNRRISNELLRKEKLFPLSSAIIKGFL